MLVPKLILLTMAVRLKIPSTHFTILEIFADSSACVLFTRNDSSDLNRPELFISLQNPSSQ